MINQLPEAHRTVLLLIAVEGFSYKEAAELLDVPMGTIMSRLARAREKIGRLVQQGETKTGLPQSQRERRYEKSNT